MDLMSAILGGASVFFIGLLIEICWIIVRIKDISKELSILNRQVDNNNDELYKKIDKIEDELHRRIDQEMAETLASAKKHTDSRIDKSISK